MTIEQLRFFLAIEKYNSFSEAAAELYVSQSTLSKKIKALEFEVGEVLFSRTTRSIKITPVGNVIAKHARHIVAEYDAMMREAKSLQVEPAVIKIAAIPVLGAYNLLPVFDDFQKAYPHITLEIEERDREIVLDELLKGLVDFAVLRSKFVDKNDINSIPIHNDELVLVVPENHELAGEDEINLERAAEETFFLLSRHTGFYEFCIAECGKAGFYPNVNKNAISRDSLKWRVKKGDGVSLMAKFVAEDLVEKGLKIIKLKEATSLDISFVAKNEKMQDNKKLLFNYVKQNTNWER